MNEMIRILIADDHPIVREGLKTLLRSDPQILLVGEAADGDELMAKIPEVQPDIVLYDLIMPRSDGLVTIRRLRRQYPQVCILVLTGFLDESQVFPIIQAGVSGYILKDSEPRELLLAIHAVHQGKSPLHPAIAQHLIRELTGAAHAEKTDALTPRELDVLRLVAQGLSNQDIADRLVISERTARTHVSNILDKLRLANRTQATLYALKHGLIVESESA